MNNNALYITIVIASAACAAILGIADAWARRAEARYPQAETIEEVEK